MKGGIGEEHSDGRKNRAGKLNYIAANKYKIMTFVLAGLVIINAAGITGWVVNNVGYFEVSLLEVAWASNSDGPCEGLNKGQCDNNGCCEWDGPKWSGECLPDGKPSKCYECNNGSWEPCVDDCDNPDCNATKLECCAASFLGYCIAKGEKGACECKDTGDCSGETATCSLNDTECKWTVSQHVLEQIDVSCGVQDTCNPSCPC